MQRYVRNRKESMKIAVMADIHSNIEAFKACLVEAEKQQVSEFLFLGDYLGDLACPQETLGLLKDIRNKYPCTFIRGNKEEYWINNRKQPNDQWVYGRTPTGMLKYNFDRLSSEDIDFFENMPITKKIQYEGYPPFVICHGSPFKVNQSMRPDYKYIDDLLGKVDTNFVICGHFHIQMDYTRKGIRVINPGSVGVPLHSGGKAQFMILHGDKNEWSTEFYTVGYDKEKAIGMMNAERLPEIAPGWYRITKHLLQTGEISHAVVVRMVMEKYEKEIGNGELYSIPEDYWTQVIDEMFESTDTIDQDLGRGIMY